MESGQETPGCHAHQITRTQFLSWIILLAASGFVYLGFPMRAPSPTVVRMSDAPMPTPPREPEIEFLGMLARGMVRLVRVALWCGGAYALVYGFQQMLDPSTTPEVPGFESHSDRGAVWFALALPLVVPAKWVLEKGPMTLGMLTIFVTLWFAPMLLSNDSPYGYILRLFATLISLMSILVWRTVWRLTLPDPKTT